MARALSASTVVIATMLVSACGGGGTKHDQPHTAQPVSEQVRQALVDALKSPALLDMSPAQRPRLPYVGVGVCVGPQQGGVGRYRCTTTPRGPHGVHSISVQVRRDGAWSTQPLTVRATLYGRPTTAETSVWGAGIHLPS
jgi:hypothetical protein